MLTITQDRTPGVYPTEGMRRTRALQQQGIADGAAGRPIASEHPDYGTGYESAARIRRVEQGRTVFMLSFGACCRVCGAAASTPAQQLKACDCAEFNAQSVAPGMFVMHGEGATEEDAVFMTNERLRQIADDGVPIETPAGLDVTHHVYPLQ